jgi:hypothetical protein
MHRLPWWVQVVVGVLVALAGLEGVRTDDQVWAKLLFVVVLASGVFNVADGLRRRSA